MSYELHIPSEIEVTRRNPVTGRFMKGHKPFNKGRKMSEYMSKEKIEHIKSHLKRTGNPNIGGWNKKTVFAFKENKLIGIYKSATLAGKKLNICDRNIRSVCNHKRKSAGGYQFYYEDDEKLLHILN